MHLVINKNYLVNFSPSGNCYLSIHSTMMQKNPGTHFYRIQFQSILFCSNFDLPTFPWKNYNFSIKKIDPSFNKNYQQINKLTESLNHDLLISAKII